MKVEGRTLMKVEGRKLMKVEGRTLKKVEGRKGESKQRVECSIADSLPRQKVLTFVLDSGNSTKGNSDSPIEALWAD